MSMGYNVDPSLGQLYRSLEARIARALQTSMRKKQSNYQNRLEQLQLKLEAWSQIIDYKNDVLEEIERDNGELAATTRQSFMTLSMDMEHLEVFLGLLDSPSDGSQVRNHTIAYLENSFEVLFMNRTKDFTPYSRRGLSRISSTRTNSTYQHHSIQPSQTHFDHTGPSYPRSSQYHDSSRMTNQPSISRPPFSTRHRSSQSVQLLTKSASVSKPESGRARRRPSPTQSSCSSPTETAVHSPAVPFAASPNATNAWPPIPQRLPSIAPLLASTESKEVQQTPSTSSTSAHSSPITPACNIWAHQYSFTQSPTVSNDRPGAVRLPPIQTPPGLYANRLRTLEPRYDRFPGPNDHVDAFRRPSMEWLATNGRITWNRRSGLF